MKGLHRGSAARMQGGGCGKRIDAYKSVAYAKLRRLGM